MPVLRCLLRIAERPHLPRRTIRLRLTALYGLLFTISGAALLVITNVLVRSATSGGSCHTESKGSEACTIPGHYGKGFLTISGFSAARRMKGTASRQVNALSRLANSQN